GGGPARVDLVRLARGGEGAAEVEVPDLGGDAVAGVALPVVGGVVVARVGVAALDHEPLDGAVERGGVVERLLHEPLEVVAVDGGVVEEADNEAAARGVDGVVVRLGERLRRVRGDGVGRHLGAGGGEGGEEGEGEQERAHGSQAGVRSAGGYGRRRGGVRGERVV